MDKKYSFDESMGNLSNNTKTRLITASKAWDNQCVPLKYGTHTIMIHPSEIKTCKVATGRDFLDLAMDITRDLGDDIDESLKLLFTIYGDEYDKNTSDYMIGHVVGLAVQSVAGYIYDVKLGERQPEKSYKKMIRQMLYS